MKKVGPRQKEKKLPFATVKNNKEQFILERNKSHPSGEGNQTMDVSQEFLTEIWMSFKMKHQGPSQKIRTESWGILILRGRNQG